MEIPIPLPGRTDSTLYWKCQNCKSGYAYLLPVQSHRDVWSFTFWMSVMSISLITLFFLELLDLALELSKHR